MLRQAPAPRSRRLISAAFDADSQRATSSLPCPARAAWGRLLGPGWLWIKGCQETHLPSPSCATLGPGRAGSWEAAAAALLCGSRRQGRLSCGQQEAALA